MTDRIRASMARVNMSMNREIWNKAGRVLQEAGLSRSRFVELILRQIADADTKSAGQMVDDIALGIFEGCKTKSKRGE